MKIIRGKRSFDLDSFLEKPLFAHLATTSEEGARDSPVWFLWQDNCLWIIGTPEDTFPSRIEKSKNCAIGIVDFDVASGKVLHAGFRGTATIESFNTDLAKQLFTKYLGEDEEVWDTRFSTQNHENVFVRFMPDTVVVRDQSYTNKDERS